MLEITKGIVMTFQPSILQRISRYLRTDPESIHLGPKSYQEIAGDAMGCIKQLFEPLWNLLPSPVTNENIHLRGRDSGKSYLGGVVAVVATGVCAALILKCIANLSKTTSLDGRITTV
jgi:hypothetical protein